MKQEVLITTIDGTPLYTKEEVAEMLETSVSTIDRYISIESIKPIQCDKLRRVLFTKESIKKTALITGRADKLLSKITLR